ncbi:hypothetical protein TanjilG_07801 [Lupinus angustifolius]|uniref:non-specific serine/threonine protein kinase n=1 Tax=Lupinus angustifolius TaxID=3871 RepID=A0A1J7HDZ6_LUPAN|nr:PREDICTED: serine/threonine-protein kinase prpf4B-like isoform X3 [Lupinus angustifolius]OIW04666.1 hypothetical protein TanjilG_07801 [Lupinus angustifolius]
MVTDGHKHRRSISPGNSDKSSKRHKHRHHHRRHHRHRHGSRKRDEENEYDCETVPAVPSPIPATNSAQNRHMPVDDAEEGEILEVEDGDVRKKQIASYSEAGEIEVIGDRDPRSDKANSGLHANNSKVRSEGISDEIIFSPAFDAEDRTCRQNNIGHRMHEDEGSPNLLSASPKYGKDARGSTNNMGNGHLNPKSPKREKRRSGEIGSYKGNEIVKGEYDDDLEVDGGKVNYHRNSSSKSGEKYRSGHLPSRDRYRSRSRSNDHARDRSRSRSIVEEHRRHSGEQGDYPYAGRSKSDREHDDERMVVRRSEIYRSREARDTSMDMGVDRDLQREKKRENSRNREVDRVCRREKEHGSSHVRHRRDAERGKSREKEDDSGRRRENERDRSRETVYERDMRREKQRDRSRDRTRGDGRDRVWESRQNDKNQERDKSKETEKEKKEDRNRHKYKDIVNGKGEHLHCNESYDSRDRYRRHSRHEETEWHRERKLNSEPVKVYNSMDSTLVDDENKLDRGEDEDDLDEKVTLQLPDQEEEDLNRIKEESRRRREAILEKYKKQQQQQEEQTTEIEGKDKQTEETPPAIPKALYGKNNDVDGAEVSFSVGKSPAKNGNVASGKISVAGGLREGTPKSERSDDMFCDDIFGETPTGVRKLGKGDGLQIERGGLHDNWDDAEGYYSYRFGEILDGRYEVTAAHGMGVFSTVVRAKNLKDGNGEPEEVAIKIIRSNDTMYKAGMDESVILKKLVGADLDDKRHCVRFLSSFKYRNHLCLVFESLHMNMREVLKKFGRNIGLKLTAVRTYAKQLFIALKHLRNCGVLHCDIKPDNMLVNEAKNVLKLCDFGNAMFAGKNEVTPYLVSRFYRAPEIILGLTYDHPLDMWSVGCCLYELYSGKVLFPGSTNNDMLRLHMELKGPFPKKMLRKGAFTEQHFDLDLNFFASEEDPVTKKTIKRMIVNIKPKDIGTIITGSTGEDPKMLANFKDLLEKVFVLDPDKRLTVSEALNHSFITGK